MSIWIFGIKFEIFQIALIVFAVFALTRVILQKRQKNFSWNEFYFWAVIWVCLIVVSFIQPLLQWTANLIGISRGVDILIYGGITVIFYMVYRLYAKVDSQQQEITELVSKIAINNARKKK